MRLRPVSVALSFLLLLLLAYAAWWSSAIRQLRAAVDDHIAQVEADGGEVTFAALEAGGFPLDLTLTARDLTVREGDGTGWAVGTAVLAARAWNPLAPTVTVDGGFAFTPAPAADGRAPVATTAGAVTADLAFTTTGDLVGLRAVATDIKVPTRPDGPALHAARLTAAYAAPSAGGDGSGHELSATLHEVTPPLPANAPLVAALGRTVQQVSIDAVLTGTPPGGLTAAEMRKWSSSGGLVQVPSLRVVWGGLDMVGDATLALDTTLQPEGAGTLSIAGGETVVRAAADAGLIAAEQADQLRPVLTLMAQPDADGVKRIRLPLTLQNRRLSLGPFLLADLPPIDWPAAP